MRFTLLFFLIAGIYGDENGQAAGESEVPEVVTGGSLFLAELSWFQNHRRLQKLLQL